MLVKPLVRPICRPLTSAITAALGGFNPRIVFERSVAFIGDSRVYDSEYEWKNVTFTDSKGLTLSVGYCTGQGITADSVGGGTLEYRASDANLRWTAPGDTAGPWKAMTLGWFTLESGAAGKGIRIGIRSLSGLPSTDQTISVSIAGSVLNAWRAHGFCSRSMNFLRWLNGSPKFLGLGGNTTAQVVEQLSWLQAQASGAGYDVIQLSTNDISASTSLATIEANLTQIYDARRALGRRLVLVGEPARWGVDTSTALTSEQQTILDGVNAFMAAYAAANNCIFVDAFAITYDTGFSDKRPKAGVLRDTVHYSDFGAQLIGKAVADAIAAQTGLGLQRAQGSAGNLLNVGYMAGTSGTIGAWASGQAPTGWTISRASGSDATVTASVEDRTDGVAGRWMVLDVSATSGSQIIQASPGNQLIGSVGVSVGERIYAEAEIDISNVTGGLVEVDTFVQFTGSSPLATVRSQLYATTSNRQGSEASVRRSPAMVIPPATTGLRFYVWIRTEGSASAKVKVASAAIVKVTP